MHQDTIKGIRQVEVCILRIGLMHVYYTIDFYYLLLFAITVVLLHGLGFSLCMSAWNMMHYILAKLLYVYQTVHVPIKK